MTYIHWGHKQFKKEKFKPIKNKPSMFIKPNGGLWACRKNSNDWVKWCKDNDYAEFKEDNFFTFQLRKDCAIYTIDSKEALFQLPYITDHLFNIEWYCIDFEECLRHGIDAIELTAIDKDNLYFLLYGWDLNSLLVLNPEIIELDH